MEWHHGSIMSIKNSGHIAKCAVALFGCILLFPAPTMSAGSQNTILHIDKKTGIAISLNAAKSESKLIRDWGQFELTLPKSTFPISAPHCKNKIKLRLIAVPPDTPNRQAILELRWRLLETLRDIVAGEEFSVNLELDLQHYVAQARGGIQELKYCNAFSSGASAQSLQ